MSRLSQWWSTFFLRGSVFRAYVESMILFFILLLVPLGLYQRSAQQMLLTSLIFFVSPCASLYYSLRLRIPQGRWYRRFGLDWLAILFPTLLFNIAVWFGLQRLTPTMYASLNESPSSTHVFFLSLMAFPYVFFRITIRFVLWWNDLRQRRVIWALVMSNLVAVALLQALVILPIEAIVFFSDVGNSSYLDLPDDPVVQFFFRLQMSLPIIGGAILMATAVLLALLPVSIVVSYFFARRIRKRLDALLDAAHAARDGNYDTRVVVSGRDEIARLQADFNVMTENLKLNIEALRDEREKVSTLLKTRRELMANVSHELRTPIATVRGYLDSALRQQEGTDDVTLSQNDVAIIQRETLRLQTLIDDLFALSRAEVDQLAMNVRPIDAGTLIQRVVETVAPMAWRINRVEVVNNFPSNLPAIVADESRLEQVLRNLIHNSLRHTPPGGLVIISARAETEHVAIQVQDTGEGIKPEHLPHIWERFYRDPENGGTGLGLALVKSFIEAMDGQVAVTSMAGEGACFTISLPISDKPVESRPNTLASSAVQPKSDPAAVKSH